MHRHHDDRPAGVARPGAQAHENQRRLVLELAVEPPLAGDRLAEHRDGRLFPSAATRALEILWPLAM